MPLAAPTLRPGRLHVFTVPCRTNSRLESEMTAPLSLIKIAWQSLLASRNNPNRQNQQMRENKWIKSRTIPAARQRVS